jgi:hypothetical protein
MIAPHAKKIAATAILLGVAWFLWLLWHWQPERQVHLHQQNLLRAVEKRNWKKVSRMIDDRFTTTWGIDKPTALREGAEVFRHFFSLQIIWHDPVVWAGNEHGQARGRMEFTGKGTAIAELVKSHVNTATAPTTFAWRRPGWQPWRWTLMSVENPEITIPQNPFSLESPPSLMLSRRE